MTDYDRIEALALLRGVNTSLLHLLATAPIYALTPIADAYKSARTAIRVLEFRSLGAAEKSVTDSVAFRHGDIDKVCASGEFAHSHRTIWDRDPSEPGAKIVRQYTAGFTQPPNCVHESTKSNEFGHVEVVDRHPMAAVALEMAEAKQPRRSESAWGVTWPCTSAHDASEVARRDLNERYKRAGKAFEMLYPKPDAPQTENQTRVGN